MGLLTGKRALITGVVSPRSIAAGIAKAMHDEGAEIALSYFGERVKPHVEKLGAQWDASERILSCDVQSDESIQSLMTDIQGFWPEGFDILVHSIAFAPADQLEGDYLTHVTREGFRLAHDVSSYSLAALGQTALPLMKSRQGAMVALTYLGAEKAVPSYNVMGIAKASLEANIRYMALSLGQHGIRINGISAGPIKTLAASGIKGFKEMLKTCEQTAPLRRNVSTEEVGKTATFLCSDWASGITGEILHVDGGFSNVALTQLQDHENT